jgi:hypothetical protein
MHWLHHFYIMILHQWQIFAHYYGFLGIRYIIRVVCIGTLIENTMLDEFLGGLDSEMDSTDVTHQLAKEVLQQMDYVLSARDCIKTVEMCTSQWRCISHGRGVEL